MEKNCSKRGINNWKILSEEVATCPLSDIWKLTRQQLVEQPEQPDLTLKLALAWGGSWTTGLQRSRPNYSTLFVSPAFWGKKEKLQKSSVKAELSSKVNRPYHRPKQNNNARRLPDLPKVTTSFTAKSTSETTDDWEGPQPDTWHKGPPEPLGQILTQHPRKESSFLLSSCCQKKVLPSPKKLHQTPPHLTEKLYLTHATAFLPRCISDPPALLFSTFTHASVHRGSGSRAASLTLELLFPKVLSYEECQQQ